jgi:hypothetical protein
MMAEPSRRRSGLPSVVSIILTIALNLLARR